jgi:hypothetical protein
MMLWKDDVSDISEDDKRYCKHKTPSQKPSIPFFVPTNELLERLPSNCTYQWRIMALDLVWNPSIHWDLVFWNPWWIFFTRHFRRWTSRISRINVTIQTSLMKTLEMKSAPPRASGGAGGMCECWPHGFFCLLLAWFFCLVGSSLAVPWFVLSFWCVVCCHLFSVLAGYILHV